MKLRTLQPWNGLSPVSDANGKWRNFAIVASGCHAHQGTMAMTNLDGKRGIVGASTTTVTFGNTHMVSDNHTLAQLVYTNWGFLTGNESVHNKAFTIAAGLEVSVNGANFTGSTLYPLTFSGASTFSFPASVATTATTDPLNVYIPKGALTRSRTAVTPTVQSDTCRIMSLCQEASLIP